MIRWQWQVFFHSPGDVFRRRLDAKTRKCRVDFFAIGARLRHDSGWAEKGRKEPGPQEVPGR